MPKTSILSLLLLGILSPSVCAQNSYRLHFDGKPESQTIALSERALERRARQGIPLDSLDREVSPVYIDAIRTAGYRIIQTSRWLNSAVIEAADGLPLDTDALLDIFPFVKQVEVVRGTSVARKAKAGQDVLMRSFVTEEQNRAKKERFEETVLPSNPSEGESFRQPVLEIRGDALYNAGHRGEGMQIAVIDGGFKRLNTVVSLYDKVIGAYNLYDPSQPDSLYTTASAHGAHCMSVIASDYEQGVWGLAPEADYYLILSEWGESETPFEEDQWVAGAELADSLGVDLINSSLGYFEFDNPLFNHTQDQLGTLEVFSTRGAQVAASRGILVCSAAGNERGKAWQKLGFPSDAPDVLTIGGTDSTGEVTFFSSAGYLSPTVKPDVSARAQSAYVIEPTTGNVAFATGTSFSTPLVCGAAAALWSAYPLLTAAQMRDIIRQSAHNFAAPDSLLGYGIPNFERALELVQAMVTSIPAVRDLHPHAQPQTYDLHGRSVGDKPRRGLHIRGNKIIFVQ